MTQVRQAAAFSLAHSGYDVVSYFVRTSPECSPLSCNSLAAELPVNERCLFDSVDEAYAAVDRGAFKDCEPGPYRIIAIYLVNGGEEQRDLQ